MRYDRTEPTLDDNVPMRLEAPGICDACGRGCCTLDQAGGVCEPGIVCYHCRQGHFRHRGEWDFTWCKACAGQGMC